MYDRQQYIRIGSERELEIKFNVAYAIAKEELPFTKYRPLLLLHKKNGVNISPTYDNGVKCAEFISSISASMKSDLGDLMKIGKVCISDH